MIASSVDRLLLCKLVFVLISRDYDFNVALYDAPVAVTGASYRAGFLCMLNVAVNLVRCVLLSCWEVYRLGQDRLQVSVIKVP